MECLVDSKFNAGAEITSVGSAHSEATTMSGGGIYSLATTGAKNLIDATTPLVLNSISALPLKDFEQGFTILDMGISDAGTTLTMIDRILTDTEWTRCMPHGDINGE